MSADELARVEAALNERGPGRMVPNRERIEALLDLLGNPQRAYPAIHITGTNGKTSTARMVDSLLRAFGLRVGRYTSPHLDSITERIGIDGEPSAPEKFVEAYDDVAPFADLLDAKSEGGDTVTYFELTTAMAFAAFADTPVDVAVVEVGLGGEWDATNVLNAGIAVITPIGLDHVELLGGTLASIATEKAGIVHEEATVITAVQPAEAAEPLLTRAIAVGATIAREGLEFGVISRSIAVGGQLVTIQGLGGVYDEIFLPMHGAYQAQNAAVALAAVEAFLGAGKERQLDVDAIREGFAQATAPGAAGEGPQLADRAGGRVAQPRRHDGHDGGARRGVPVQPARGRGRGARRQGRPRHPRAAGAGRRLDRGHPELLTPGAARGRARGAGRGGLRARPGGRGAAARRRVGVRDQDRRGGGRRADQFGRRAGHRLGHHRRRRAPAAPPMTSPDPEPTDDAVSG